MGPFLTASWLMFRTQLTGVVRSKRMLVCLALVTFPPLVASFPAHRESAFEIVAILGMMLSLQVVAPLVGLIAGSAVVTEEVENRTITYVFTRPVPRAALFLGRWVATAVVIAALLALSAWAVTWVASAEGLGPATRERGLPVGLVGRYVWSCALAGGVYSLLTAALGVFLRRPMIVGLGYAMAFEVLLANVPLGVQKITVQFYARGILTGLEDARDGAARFWREFEPIQDTIFLSPADSSLRLLVVVACGVVLATWGITRRQFVLTS